MLSKNTKYEKTFPLLVNTFQLNRLWWFQFRINKYTKGLFKDSKIRNGVRCRKKKRMCPLSLTSPPWNIKSLPIKYLTFGIPPLRRERGCCSVFLTEDGARVTPTTQSSTGKEKATVADKHWNKNQRGKKVCVQIKRIFTRFSWLWNFMMTLIFMNNP